VLTNNLSSEVSARIADVDAEQSRAESAELVLTNSISTEVSNRVVAIDAEASSRIAGDLSLQNQIDFITSNIDPVAIDSLTEIVSAFQSADGNLNGAITGLSYSISVSLSEEVSRAQSAETVLTNDLSTEVSNRIADVDTEESRAISVEAVLSNDLSAEVSNRISGDASLEAEITALPDVDDLTIEVDASNLIKLKDTVAAPTSGTRTFDGVLALSSAPASFNNLDLVTKEYVASIEAVLSTDISAEVSRAESAELALDGRIDNALSNVDFTQIDSLSEVLNTFYQKVTYTGAINGTNDAYTPGYLLNDGSESVFLNGLLQDRGTDYSVTLTNGKVSAVIFNDVPQAGDKINVYGITNTSSDVYINA
jgi:hypothetical protein